MADQGFCFGSHGVNHNFLTRLSDSAARYEIEASKKELEDGLGQPIRFFSYPYGDYSDRIISFVREAGYEAAFSLRPEFLKAGHTANKRIFDARLSALQEGEGAADRGFGIQSSAPRIQRRDMYALPRIAIYLVDSMWAFKAKIGCVHNSSLKRKLYVQKVKNRLINRFAYASTLFKRFRS
jgi:peptidoglycan/xylan/chitin deacetylase (PgdA/CDA1 family)